MSLTPQLYILSNCSAPLFLVSVERPTETPLSTLILGAASHAYFSNIREGEKHDIIHSGPFTLLKCELCLLEKLQSFPLRDSNNREEIVFRIENTLRL